MNLLKRLLRALRLRRQRRKARKAFLHFFKNEYNPEHRAALRRLLEEAMTTKCKSENNASECATEYCSNDAPKKRVYKIDTSKTDEVETIKRLKEVKRKLKSPIVNRGSKEIDIKYNPINLDGEFYITSKDDITLEGCANLDAIEQNVFIPIKPEKPKRKRKKKD